MGDLGALAPPATGPDDRPLFELPAAGVNMNSLELAPVEQALERCHGNKTRAAALLGMTRDQIRHRIEGHTAN